MVETDILRAGLLGDGIAWLIYTLVFTAFYFRVLFSHGGWVPYVAFMAATGLVMGVQAVLMAYTVWWGSDNDVLLRAAFHGLWVFPAIHLGLSLGVNFWVHRRIPRDPA